MFLYDLDMKLELMRYPSSSCMFMLTCHTINNGALSQYLILTFVIFYYGDLITVYKLISGSCNQLFKVSEVEILGTFIVLFLK